MLQFTFQRDSVKTKCFCFPLFLTLPLYSTDSPFFLEVHVTKRMHIKPLINGLNKKYYERSGNLGMYIK